MSYMWRSKDSDSNNNDTLTSETVTEFAKNDVTTEDATSHNTTVCDELDNSEKSYIKALSKACHSSVFNFGAKPRFSDATASKRARHVLELPKFATIRHLNEQISTPFNTDVCKNETKVKRSHSCVVDSRTYMNIPRSRMRYLPRTPSCSGENKENMGSDVDYVNIRELTSSFGQKRKCDCLSSSSPSEKGRESSIVQAHVKRRKLLKPVLPWTKKQTRQNERESADFTRSIIKPKSPTTTGLRASLRASFRRVLKPRLSGSLCKDGLIKLPRITQTDDVNKHNANRFVDKVNGFKFAVPLSFSFRSKKKLTENA